MEGYSNRTEQRHDMHFVLITIAATLGGWLGWWLGGLISLIAAFFVSVLGSAAGVYAARRFIREYLL